MSLLFSSLLLILSPLPSWAEAPGANSLNFLKLGADARQTGMGEAGIALEDDAGSIYLNPAVLSGAASQQVHFSYDRLFDDIQHGDIGYVHPTQTLGTLAGDLQYLNYGSISAFDSTGAKIGSVSAGDRMLQLGWAPHKQAFAPGINLKIIQESLAEITATAVALDAGVLFHPFSAAQTPSFWDRQLGHLAFGASMRNLSPGAKFQNQTEILPASFGVGVAHQSFGDALKFALDVDRTVGQRRALAVHFGSEGWIKDAVAVRIGFQTNQDIGVGFSFGVGFKTGQWLLDYGVRPFGELGFVHRAGLSFRFGGGLVEDYYEKGLRDLRLGNYADAVIWFDKALAIDPKNKKVIDKALEAAKGLQSEEEKH